MGTKDSKPKAKPLAVISGGSYKQLFSTRKKVYIFFGIIGLVLLAVFAWVMYDQIIANTKVDPVLDGISKDDERYENMSPQQVDAQLKRQTGHTLTELKQEEKITAGLFDDHQAAMRSAKALRSVQEHEKGLQAYGVAAGLAGSEVNFQFHVDYAWTAASNDNFTVAFEQYKIAKQKLEQDPKISEAQKKELLSDINWQIAVNEARAKQ